MTEKSYPHYFHSIKLVAVGVVRLTVSQSMHLIELMIAW